jgi:CRISPR-associated endoribonuclease Cas6
MLLDPELKQLHGEERIFKGYVFSNFYPIEKDGYYKSGKVYVWRLRAVSESLLKKFRITVKKTTSAFIKTLATEIKIAPYRHISELYTINPAILTLEDNQPFLPTCDLLQLSHAIQTNLEKKCRYFTHNPGHVVQPLVRRIQMINRKPVKTRYKHMSMLGNKMKLFVSEDEFSQKLAQMALNTGLLEKNAILGSGFVVANFTGR